MSKLVPCDINTHSTSIMMRQFNIHPKLVYHIGAHDGIEADIYDYYKAKVRWFECNPFVYPNLLTRVRHRPNHYTHEVCLWNEDGRELPFFFYRNKEDGAGGLYKPDKMFDYIKDCPLLEETVSIKTTKLDTMVDDLLHNEIDDVDFLNIDVQGAELQVFKGAHTLLSNPSLKWIWCEVSWDDVYQGGAKMIEIDDYLWKYGYSKVGIRKDWEIHGDALYKRN